MRHSEERKAFVRKPRRGYLMLFIELYAIDYV